jgi:hypothetical protein
LPGRERERERERDWSPIVPKSIFFPQGWWRVECLPGKQWGPEFKHPSAAKKKKKIEHLPSMSKDLLLNPNSTKLGTKSKDLGGGRRGRSIQIQAIAVWYVNYIQI